MKHGRDCPDRCSLCSGSPARVVELAAGQVVIDGVATRPSDAEGIPAQMRMARMRAARVKRRK